MFLNLLRLFSLPIMSKHSDLPLPIHCGQLFPSVFLCGEVIRDTWATKYLAQKRGQLPHNMGDQWWDPSQQSLSQTGLAGPSFKVEPTWHKCVSIIFPLKFEEYGRGWCSLAWIMVEASMRTFVVRIFTPSTQLVWPKGETLLLTRD